MLVVGVGIGIGAFFGLEWTFDTIVPQVDPTAQQIISDLGPLIMLFVLFASTPVIGGIIGLIEGRNITYDRQRLLTTMFSCLLGGILVVLISMAIIGTAGEGGGGPEFAVVDLLSIAGLVGISSAFTSGLAMAITGEL